MTTGEPEGFDLEPALPERPPAWPGVIGMISIVIASISLACGGCGLAVYGAMMPNLMRMMPEEMGPMPAVMRAPPAFYVNGGIGIGVSILLLAAGIATLRRRPVGRRLHLVWAVLALINGLWGTWIALEWQAAIQEFARANPDHPWAQQQAGGRPAALAGIVISAVLAVAWPLFTLVWFGAVKPRPEQMGAAAAEPLI